MTASLAPQSETPVQRDRRRDKRNRIVDAAISVFARTGYHGARISDIACEAGIAYGLVYHYFKNKEEILNTIFEERWTGFLEAVDEIADGSTPTQDKLVSIAALILNAYRVRPEWVKVFVLEIQRSSRFAEPGQIRAVGRLFQTITRILHTGQASGELRRDLDPDVACYVLIGGLEIMITALVLGVIRIEEQEQGKNEYYVKVAQTVVEIFLNGFSAGDRE